jgi:hypothetical protein
MMRPGRKRNIHCRPKFLLALVLLTVLMPFPTFAMERDGAVFFFSREDVHPLFSHPLYDSSSCQDLPGARKTNTLHKNTCVSMLRSGKIPRDWMGSSIPAPGDHCGGE